MIFLSQDKRTLYDTISGPLRVRKNPNGAWVIEGDHEVVLGVYDSEEAATARFRAISQRHDVIQL